MSDLFGAGFWIDQEGPFVWGVERAAEIEAIPVIEDAAVGAGVRFDAEGQACLFVAAIVDGRALGWRILPKQGDQLVDLLTTAARRARSGR